MSNSTNLNLPYLLSNQAQKHVTMNEALKMLDVLVQLSVVDNTLSAPPQTPSEGDSYTIASSPTGDWQAKENQVTIWHDGAWSFYPPNKGWITWVENNNSLQAYNGSDWVDISGVLSASTAPIFGINAAADTTNRLSINSGAILFNKEIDDVQVKLNKQASTDNASFLFQTNFSGRAEMGTSGDDDFHFKVSSDGTTWNDGILIDATTGEVSFPNTTLATMGSTGTKKDNRTFPRDRSRFGLVYQPSVSTMNTSEVTFPNWDEVEITAGVGNNYYAVLSNSHVFNEAGATLLVFIRIESGTHDAPILTLLSADRGTETINFTEEIDGLWVAETIIPASGFSSVKCNMLNADASNICRCSKFMFAFSPAGSTGIRNEYETDAIQAWVTTERQEGRGNLWPANINSYSVDANVSSKKSKKAYVTTDNGAEILALCYIEDEDGNPANIDRCYIQFGSAAYNTAKNVYLNPLGGYQGVYAVKFTASGFDASHNLELYIDNKQTIAAYTEKDVIVKDIQLYQNLIPTQFSSPENITFSDPNEIHVNEFEGVLRVLTPTFETTGNKYIGWQFYRNDTSSHVRGGGIFTSLEDIFYCQRTSQNNFKVLNKGNDAGLNSFAIKPDLTPVEFVGGEHGGQERRSSPELLIDDVVVTADIRADFVCQKIEYREFYKLYSPVDGTTVFANVDVVHIWENQTYKKKNTITYLVAMDLITDYMFMLSVQPNWENSNNDKVWDEITLPNQSDAIYTPSSAMQSAYPSETHFRMKGGNNLTWNVEVQGTAPSTFRSWIQLTGTSRKVYMAPNAITGNPGLATERGNAVSVAANEVVELEVWTSVKDTA